MFASRGKTEWPLNQGAALKGGLSLAQIRGTNRR
jgi:hypothetical protein